MLPLLKKWATAFDALSLRERVMLFGAGVAALLFVFYFMVFGPLWAKRAALDASIAQKQSLVSATNQEIELVMLAHANDPDRDARARLTAVLAETASLKQALRQQQHGLVAPERMVSLLENLLRQHARLRLVSLRTLPVESVGAPAVTPATPPVAGTAPVAALPPVVAPAPVLHRHGVEVVVQGSYADMLAYMQALQAMPTSVFWGQAQLDAQAYPAASLTLTLHTLSTDESWMAL